MSVEVRQCRWCLESFEATNPRREYCCAEHRKRHFSRARYGTADGYGAALTAVRCCRCDAVLPPAPIVQGRNSKRLCQSCQLPVEHPCPACGRAHRGPHQACSLGASASPALFTEVSASP